MPPKRKSCDNTQTNIPLPKHQKNSRKCLQCDKQPVLEFLVKVLKQCFQAVPKGPQDFLRVIHLFFDGFDFKHFDFQTALVPITQL